MDRDRGLIITRRGEGRVYGRMGCPLHLVQHDVDGSREEDGTNGD